MAGKANQLRLSIAVEIIKGKQTVENNVEYK